MPSAFVSSAWVQPVSVEPDLIINRDRERQQIARWLADRAEMGTRDARGLVTGDRGVGKSILCRRALADFAQVNAAAVTVTVDGRGRAYRDFLVEITRRVVDAFDARLEAKDPLRRWMDELSLLAVHHQVRRSQTDSIAKKYGIQGAVEADGLFVKLKSLFTWEENRSSAKSDEATTTVTDEVLHRAISETFERISHSDHLLVVLFDDLDQAVATTQEEIVRIVGNILRLRPCLGLVHLRDEMMYQDVRREIDVTFSLPALEPIWLLEILKKRMDVARERVSSLKHLATPESHLPFKQLAEVARGNPYVFLRWVEQLLAVQAFPPVADWRSDAALWAVVGASAPGADEALIRPVAQAVDRCALSPERPWCSLADLERGKPVTDTTSAQAPSRSAIDHLVQLEYLIRRNRFEDPPVYRLDPVLELLRPSVANALRAI